MTRERIPVGVLGATGTVGQRFVSLLASHPWFELALVTGSERSIGKRYADAVEWTLPTPLPSAATELQVRETKGPLDCRLLFSALGSGVAGPAERELADAGHFVVSNASSHRMNPDVPLIVPEVNPEHLELLAHRSGNGAVVTNPNCSTIGLVMALAPIHRRFGVQRVNVVTMQAISGAGLPGVPSLAILDNVVPWIEGEEEKLERETRKVLGRLEERHVTPADITVSAQCNRVPVLDGHTECISIGLRRQASVDELRATLSEFASDATRELPSAPQPPLVVSRANDRPQPRLDRDRGNGMAVTIGRLRPCPILDYRLVVLSHNTVRGAAGGALLVAELAHARGLVG